MKEIRDVYEEYEFDNNDFGKTVFFTESEAEIKLEELKSTNIKNIKKRLNIMKYNKEDEEYINALVTGVYWKDIKKAFKKDADDNLKRIYHHGNCYQCRIIDNGFCIGAKNIYNPERLDLTDVKEYIENAIDSIHNAKGLLESINIDTLNENFEHIKEEIRECYKEIDKIEEKSYF